MPGEDGKENISTTECPRIQEEKMSDKGKRSDNQNK
jgi:hypothetical protein